MATTYLVHVLDSSGGPAAILDTVSLATLNYKRVLNGADTFQLTLRYDHPAAALLSAKHCPVEIIRYGQRRDAHCEVTGLVYYSNVFEDEDGATWLIVSGLSLEFELAKRVIDVRDDPLGAGGYSTKEGAAETVMRALVNEQAGALATGLRSVAGLSVGSDNGAGNTVRGRWTWQDNLLEVLQSLTVQGGVDFYITRASGRAYTFEAGAVGADLTRTANWPGSPFVVFDPRLGNLSDPALTRDWRGERTNVLLLGQGSGDYRYLYGALASQIYDTPYSYGEVTIDARQTEDGSAAALITQAQHALLENRAQEMFEFGLPPQVARMQYNDLWTLGDRVTAQWGVDYRQDMRITAVEVNVSGDGESIMPTLEAQNV